MGQSGGRAGRGKTFASIPEDPAPLHLWFFFFFPQSRYKRIHRLKVNVLQLLPLNL